MATRAPHSPDGLTNSVSWSRQALIALGTILLVFSTSCTETPPAESESDPLIEVRPEPIHRLSVAEYEATLADLFVGLTVDVPPLPSDPKNHGFTNHAESLTVSQLHLIRLEATAVAYAKAATTDVYLSTLLPCTSWDTPQEQDTCGKAFVRALTRRAFRGQVDDVWLSELDARMTTWTSSIDFAASVELAIVSVLMAPEFFYRVERTVTGAGSEEVIATSAYELASRLSYALWGSMPDDALLDAAQSDALLTDEGLAAQVERMQASPKAAAHWTTFHMGWLGLDELLTDEHARRVDYPSWDAAVQMDAYLGLIRFLEHIYDTTPTLEALLTDRTAFVTGRTATFSGIDLPLDADWTKVTLSATERAGILTRVGVLATRSHPAYGSPPIRGNYARERFLCGYPLNPPPEADLSQPKADPADGPKTNRELFAARTSGTACIGCHAQLDGLGFGFENYDAAGVYRTVERGLPIDASGELVSTDVDGPYVGLVELSTRLASSADVRRCYVRRMLQFVYGRVIGRDDDGLVDALAETFNGGNTKELWGAIVKHPRFRQRTAVGQ